MRAANKIIRLIKNLILKTYVMDRNDRFNEELDAINAIKETTLSIGILRDKLVRIHEHTTRHYNN